MELIAKDLRDNCERKDRRYRLKTYSSVFLGCDAVAHLVSSQKITVDEAKKLGNLLIREKYFHHVADDHLLEDSKLFYRFYADESSSTSPNSKSNIGNHRSNSSTSKNNEKYKNNEIQNEEITSTTTTSTNSTTIGRLSTQQQLIQFRLQVQGQLAETEAANSRMHNNFQFQINQFERSLHLLLRIVVILSCIILILVAWQPLVSGWFGYLMIVTVVGFCLRMILSSVRTVAQQHDVSTYELLTGSSDADTVALFYDDNLQNDNETDSNGNNNNNNNINNNNNNNDDDSMTSLQQRNTNGSPVQNLPPLTEWIQKPVLLRMESNHPSHKHRIMLANDLTQIYTIDNEFFQGRIIILLKHLNKKNPEDKSEWISQYFHGKKRVMANYIQGRFKKKYRLNEIITGQTFKRPLAGLPSRFLIQTVFSFLRTIAPGLKADILRKDPYLFSPLIAAAQTVHVARSQEDAPSLNQIAKGEIDEKEIENTKLIGPKFNELNMNATKRRKHFKSNIDNINQDQSNYYDPSFIYTFGFWQDLFDPVDYCAHLPFAHFELFRFLNGQPMSVLAKVGYKNDDKYLWDVKVYHEKLIPARKKGENN